MGGIHASLCTDEALKYVDSVVVGEAEQVWKKVIADFEKSHLQRVYKAEHLAEIHQVLPRRDLFHPAYIAASVQTSRGCPLNCSFCSVTAFNGRQYRFRPIDDVVEELCQIPQRYIFFVDDNIIGYTAESKERAARLFEAIIKSGIKKHWISQASVNFADDPDLLKLAARSGCRMVFLGLESELPEQLKQGGKWHNIKTAPLQYSPIFKKIHAVGIGVIAGYIFGWDTDTPEAMRNRLRYLLSSKADSFQISVLTPLPGTRLYDTLSKENRLIYTDYPEDWKRYDFTELVIRHPSMSPEQFQKNMKHVLSSIYSPVRIILNFFTTLLLTRKWRTAIMLGLNYYHYRRIFLREGVKINN